MPQTWGALCRDASREGCVADVRSWSKAEVVECPLLRRCWGTSGHQTRLAGLPDHEDYSKEEVARHCLTATRAGAAPAACPRAWRGRRAPRGRDRAGRRRRTGLDIRALATATTHSRKRDQRAGNPRRDLIAVSSV